MLPQPSRTAWGVALRRAAHQTQDAPLVFADRLALRITGGEWRPRAGEPEAVSRMFRAFMAVRSRFAEDELARAVEAGARQYVILGAGLDTLAYRNPYAEVNVFEVDHPATQEWKKQLLARAEIAIPPNMKFAPVDFERESLAEKLRQAGLKEAPAFFSWLGVTPYLTRAAFDATLAFIAAQPAGSGVVFDYCVPPSSMKEMQRRAFEALAERVAQIGEPFRLFLSPSEIEAHLRRLGFAQIEDLNGDAINERYFHSRADGLGVRGGAGRLLSAFR
ncbi:MAG TPA: class I SAM-dependent methyltransferase [Bryobacteraceae bacterium]|nr:class I SAM-dependent methyltransferase [Bryobacteraceae bacterium]